MSTIVHQHTMPRYSCNMNSLLSLLHLKRSSFLNWAGSIWVWILAIMWWADTAMLCSDQSDKTMLIIMMVEGVITTDLIMWSLDDTWFHSWFTRLTHDWHISGKGFVSAPHILHSSFGLLVGKILKTLEILKTMTRLAERLRLIRLVIQSILS